MNLSKILAVDADPTVRSILCERLRQAGHEVFEASSASSALSTLRKTSADLVILDESLPDLRGLDVLREIKRSDQIGPLRVVMTTSSTGENFVVQALERGADDCLVKPYALSEIVARVQLGLRRAPVNFVEDSALTVGRITIDEQRHEVRIDGNSVELSPLEYRLLYFFATNQDRMFTREQLLVGVWKNREAVSLRTVDVNVRRLRRQLAPSGCDEYVQTIRSNGYRFSV